MNEINQSSCICFRSFHWLLNHDQGHARSARVHKVQWRCFITSITTTCTQRTLPWMKFLQNISVVTQTIVTFFALFALLWRGGWWGMSFRGLKFCHNRWTHESGFKWMDDDGGTVPVLLIINNWHVEKRMRLQPESLMLQRYDLICAIKFSCPNNLGKRRWLWLCLLVVCWIKGTHSHTGDFISLPWWICGICIVI